MENALKVNPLTYIAVAVIITLITTAAHLSFRYGSSLPLWVGSSVSVASGASVVLSNLDKYHNKNPMPMVDYDVYLKISQ